MKAVVITWKCLMCDFSKRPRNRTYGMLSLEEDLPVTKVQELILEQHKRDAPECEFNHRNVQDKEVSFILRMIQ
jgi:hypothetical protein